MIGNGYGFKVYSRVGNMMDLMRMRQNKGQSMKASGTLIAMAELFEELISNLDPHDLEGVDKFPDTFEGYMKEVVGR
jgi:hypothetical protein